MKDDFKVICEFKCGTKNMVVVKGDKAVHIMPIEEWRWTYGNLYPKRWSK